nr:HEPN domain-containing protein [Zavarzinella formosa]
MPPDDLDQIERWHFAIGGLDTQHEIMTLGGPFQLRRLRSFPSHEQLATSLTSLPVAGSIALYGEKILRHELVIDASRFEENTERIFPTAEAILAGLRIRTGAEIVCPAVCERSWSALRATPPNGCRAFHFERGLSHHTTAEPKLVLAEDIEWVRHNLAGLIKLTGNESFQTAVEALCTYMLASNDRMKVAQLWAGVEAIFDIEYELRYRLSTLAAKLLGSSGKESRAVYSEMKTLYGERSKIIHGKQLGKKKDAHEAKVREHISRIRSRLAQLLTKLIALGKVPTEEEFEEILFEE